MLNFPDFTETTFTNDVVITEQFSFELIVIENLRLKFNFCFCVRLFGQYIEIRVCWMVIYAN